MLHLFIQLSIPCIHLHIGPTLIPTNVNLIFPFLTSFKICNEDFTFLVTNRVWIFDGICVVNATQVYIPYMNLHTLMKSQGSMYNIRLTISVGDTTRTV